MALPRNSLAVTLLLAMSLGTSAAPPPRDAPLRRTVLSMVDKAQYEHAAQLCSLAIRQNPSDPEAYFLMGRVHEPWNRISRWVLDVPDEADPKATPGETQSISSHVEYEYDPSHGPVAAAAFEKAAHMAPDNLEYRAAQGFFWVNVGEDSMVRRMLPWFQKSAHRQGAVDLLRLMTARYLQRVRFEMAAQLLATLVKMLPASLSDQLMYAEVLTKAARPEDALRVLAGLKRRRPGEIEIDRAAARIHVLLGQFAKAQPLIDRLWNSEPGNPSVALDLALVQIGLKGPRAADLLAQFCILRGYEPPDARVTAMVQSLQGLLEKSPPMTADEWLFQASKLSSEGFHGAAWTSWYLAKRAGAPAFDLARTRAELFHRQYFEQGELDAWAECRRLRARQGTALDLDSARFWFGLGRHYFHWHLDGPAGRIWMKAMARPDCDADVPYHLGRVREQQGDYKEAYRMFLKAIAMKAPPAAVQKARGKIAVPRYLAMPGNPTPRPSATLSPTKASTPAAGPTARP